MVDISNRTATLGTENAFVVLADVNKRLKAGADIVNFCIGQPDFDTPEHIKEAAITAIKDGKSGYTSSSGIPELREAAANYFSRTRGVEVDAKHISTACGGKPFIYWSILSTTDHGVGDEVIYPNPGFPIYESQAKANGAVPVPIPLLEENGFSFSIDSLAEKITPKTKLLIINSPQNPTGAVLKSHELKGIADLAMDHDFWVYSDEVYSSLVYDNKFESIISIPGMEDRAIIVDCVSKSYAMTGWRLGYAYSKNLSPHFSRWMTNTDSCAPHHVQWAAVQALNGPQDATEMMTKSFKERRDQIVKGLNEIEGISCISPGGAFYALPNVTEACKKVGASSAEDFRQKLLDHGVAVLADTHFGSKNPGQEQEYIRFSYATSKEGIVEGLKRLKEFVES
ncbi:MAG: pyridoxal phosphate-dependent aminotransferase [Candidatus Undinarchaeales archaeon]|jgi:aspartate/methionine/tyrosine aminotransferase|nr:pyridoxal phosphate-dependent aminotransferase [Candidatus Undinarchaeales archaeon]